MLAHLVQHACVQDLVAAVLVVDQLVLVASEPAVLVVDQLVLVASEPEAGMDLGKQLVEVQYWEPIVESNAQLVLMPVPSLEPPPVGVAAVAAVAADDEMLVPKPAAEHLPHEPHPRHCAKQSSTI